MYAGAGDEGHLVLQTAVRFLHVYYLPSITLFGLLGNLVCCIVLTRPVLAARSPGQYMLGLCVVNTVCLLTILHTWMTNYFNVHFYRLGGWCQFIEFVRTLSEFLSVWYAVSLGIDRLVAVCCGRGWRSAACTPFRAKIVLMCAAVAGAAVFLNISLTVGVIRIAGQPVCTAVLEFAEMRDHLDKVDIVVNALMPAVVLVAVHTFIIARLVYNRFFKSAAPANGVAVAGPEQEELRRVRRETPPSLFITTVFLVFFMPQLVARIAQATNSLVYGYDNMSLHMFLWRKVCENLRCTHYALNLPVLVTFHGDFRHEIANFCRFVHEKVVQYTATRDKTARSPSGIEDSDVDTLV